MWILPSKTNRSVARRSRVYVRNNPTIYKDPGGEDIALGATDAKEQASLKEALVVIARIESGREVLCK